MAQSACAASLHPLLCLLSSLATCSVTMFLLCPNLTISGASGQAPWSHDLELLGE